MRLHQVFLLSAIWFCSMRGSAQITATAQVEHIIPHPTDSLGNIVLNVSGGTPPYTYKWMPGNITFKDLANASARTYTVKIKDSGADSVTYYYSIGYKTQWAGFRGAMATNDTLFNSSGRGWGTALSQNTFPPNAGMWFEEVMTPGLTFMQLGLLDSAFTLAGNCDDVDHGIYVYNSVLQVIINGVVYAVNYPYQKGDVFRMEHSGDSLKYKLNGTVFYSVSDPGFLSRARKIRAGVHYTSGRWINVGCSSPVLGGTYFSNYVRVIPNIIHSSGKRIPDGSIHPVAAEQSALSYTWQPGDTAGYSLVSRNKGTYQMKVHDHLNNSSRYSQAIGYKINWTDFYGTRVYNDTLVSTGAYAWGSAVSKNTLKAGTDGWIDIQLTNNDLFTQIGFLDSAYTPDSDMDVDMGLFKYADHIQRVSNGYYYSMGYWNNGDILRIERVGNVINYRQNGQIIVTDTNAAYALKDWKVKASAFTIGGPITNIGCSFEPGLEATSITEHADASYPYNGRAFISLSGGTPPYEVVWQDSLSSNYRADMSPGIYNVRVTDSTQTDTLNLKIGIGLKPAWHFNTNFSFTPDTARLLRYDSLGVSIAENSLPKNTPGWLEWKVDRLSDDRTIGFAGDTANVFSKPSGYITGFRNDNTSLTYTLIEQAAANTLTYASDSLVLSSAYNNIHLVRLKDGLIQVLFRKSTSNAYSYKVGDVIKVGRDSLGNFYLAKNSELLYNDPPSANNQYLYPLTAQGSGTVRELQAGTVRGDVYNPAKVFPNVFAVPQVKPDGGYYVPVSNHVLFTVEGEYNLSTLRFNVYSKNNTVALSNTSVVAGLISSPFRSLGDNRYALKVSTLAAGYYMLEVINEKNEKLYLRFRVTSSGIVQNPNPFPYPNSPTGSY